MDANSSACFIRAVLPLCQLALAADQSASSFDKEVGGTRECHKRRLMVLSDEKIRIISSSTSSCSIYDFFFYFILLYRVKILKLSFVHSFNSLFILLMGSGRPVNCSCGLT